MQEHNITKILLKNLEILLICKSAKFKDQSQKAETERSSGSAYP